MADKGLLASLRALLAKHPADAPTEVTVEKATPVAIGKVSDTRPAWDWIVAQRTGAHDGRPVLVEPLWAGTRALDDRASGLFDVIKTAGGRNIVVDCLRIGTRDTSQDPLRMRRIVAAKLVKDLNTAGDASWELGPATVVESRIDLAKAWEWATSLKGSLGMVVKLSGPYTHGTSPRWIGVRKSQPTAADVHADTAAGGKKKTDPKDDKPWLKKCGICGTQGTAEKPACDSKATAKANNCDGLRVLKGRGTGVRVVTKDVAKRILLGIVHQPGVEDLQGDIIDEGDIEKAAHAFMLNWRGGTSILKLDHKTPANEQAVLVENYVAPVAFDIPQPDGEREHVLKGSWLQAWQLSPQLWAKVESGEYTGLSMHGMGERESIDKEAGDPAIGGGPRIDVHVEPAPVPNIELHVHPPATGGSFRITKDGKESARLERVVEQDPAPSPTIEGAS